MSNTQQLERITTQVRRDILRMVHKVNSGHPGGSLGCAEFFVALFFEVMDRKDGFDMNGFEEDIFFLSNGHISPVFYSVLSRSGYFPVEELNTFRLINSRLQGHPTTHEGLPGVRVASGSLGQGLSVAIGAALTIAAILGGPISGGNYNPAVSIMMTAAGKLPMKDFCTSPWRYLFIFVNMYIGPPLTSANLIRVYFFTKLYQFKAFNVIIKMKNDLASVAF